MRGYADRGLARTASLSAPAAATKHWPRRLSISALRRFRRGQGSNWCQLPSPDEPGRRHDMATAYGYTRVSSQDQADSGLSLEAQKQDIERYYQYLLAPKGIAWGGLFVDPAVSGNTLLREREAGGRLNTTLQQGDHVIMAKLDRGFRRTDDCCNMVNQWKQRGITLHIRDLNLDTSTPTGDMVIKILSIVAEWERRRIGERTAAAVRIARRNGKSPHGFAGTGFRYVGAIGHKRHVADLDERAMMKHTVKSRAAGCSCE